MREPFSAATPWPAPAKLNLFLHVLGRRADGYHNLQTVFQFLDFGDDLFFSVREDGVIRHADAVEFGNDDLCLRAARALQAATGTPLGCDIRLHKRIPVGGGLGGGSSDAATTLVALNALWKLDLSTDALATLGLKLGADVPVFVRGFAAWAEGIGETLTPIELAEPWYLVLTPPVSVSTQAVFNDPALPRNTPPITREVFFAGSHRNDCERLVCRQHPAVAEALDWLRRFGLARMTGTGASVFGVFPDRAQALAAQAKVPAGWRCFVAQGLNGSPLVTRAPKIQRQE